MFDPTEMVLNGRFGYVMRHTACDYHAGTPLTERLNPLRLEVGIGFRRPCWLVINRRAWMHLKVANALFWLKQKLRRASQ